MPQDKSLFKRIIGDWSDVKRGAKMGADLRNKPYKWVEGQVGKMDAVKAEARLKKFQKRAKAVVVVILVAWILVAIFALHAKIWAVAISSILVLVLWWLTYRNVVKSAQRRIPHKSTTDS